MNAIHNATTEQITTAKNDGTRYMWMGFTMGLACMVALFIAGLVTGSAGMTVMAASTAAVLAAVWTSTAVAAKSIAKKKAVSATGA
ncbi:hypothetical protein [Arthrobacter sp. N199823]|uniref:hypothetical protein n=1 Tax=Arthrobacter sp. N199823 TaxID=2058895 RepID=UPI000CE56764|nr:hypothetical protein [Arthrobacter sp. N199823]